MKIWADDRGDFSKTLDFLKKADNNYHILPALHAAGQKGVEALRNATPKNTSLAAASWGYTIDGSKGDYTITWHNYDIEGGYNVAILIQYGHGTGTGGYVEGRDFINPSLQPIFDTLADDIWKEINR